MNGLSRSAPLPSWKNSPIKTEPSDLKRFYVASNQHKPPVHPAGPRSKVNTSMDKDSLKKLLQEASSMFDDDEDHSGESDFADAPQPTLQTTTDDAQMAAMFMSPDKSFTGESKGVVPSQLNAISSAADESYNSYTDAQSEVAKNSNTFTRQEEDVSTASYKPTNLQSILTQAHSQVQSSSHIEEAPEIDIAHELATNPALLKHLEFLISFDEEFSSNLNLGLSSDQDDAEINYQQVFLHDLNKYVHLPADVLHALVMRQHQEIVAMGIFTQD